MKYQSLTEVLEEYKRIDCVYRSVVEQIERDIANSADISRRADALGTLDSIEESCQELRKALNSRTLGPSTLETIRRKFGL